MRNIESSPWLGSPELVEIKSVALDKQKVNEFTLNLQVKRLADRRQRRRQDNRRECATCAGYAAAGRREGGSA